MKQENMQIVQFHLKDRDTLIEQSVILITVTEAYYSNIAVT